MNCNEWKKRFDTLSEMWIFSDSDPRAGSPGIEIPPELLDHSRKCPRCESRLEAFLKLAGAEKWSEENPPWLADRIWSKVDPEIRKLKCDRNRGKALDQFWRVRFVPAGAAAALGVIILVFGMYIHFNASSEGVPAAVRHSEGEVIVRFVLEAPSARKVAVVGDWNGWDREIHRLTRRNNGNGRFWELEIPLLPGREYRYQFLIDGEIWTADPEAILQVDDGFGSVNSVLEI